MLPSCRCTSDNRDVPVEQTGLLYKEVAELLRQPRRQQLHSPEDFYLREATWNLPAAGEVSW